MAKGSDDHARYLEAFVEKSVVLQEIQDLFGTTREVEVEIYSVEHAGDKTRFTLRPTKPL